jgi:hypothetical protein
MSLTKKQRLMILLPVVGLGTVVAAMAIDYARRQAELRREADRARFYEVVQRQQAGRTGPPMAKVVAADSGEPVAGAIVCMTLIGPDGGDGGFQCFVTNEAGIAHNTLRLAPGRYQPHLVPDPASRFVTTQWKRGEPYIVVAEDGTTAVPTLRLQTQAVE